MTEDPSEDKTDMKEANDSPYSSLTGSFGSVELEARDRFYDMGDAQVLLEKMKKMLRESEHGARLLDIAEARNVKFQFIKSKKLQSATTPNLELFLAAEQGQEEPYMTQVLEFGGALREIEQHLMGFKIPGNDADPLEKANIAHTKFLDKIVYMCKIGIDLEKVYSNDVQEAIKAFGYEDIYNAQVNALGAEAIEDIYLKVGEKSEAE